MPRKNKQRHATNPTNNDKNELEIVASNDEADGFHSFSEAFNDYEKDDVLESLTVEEVNNLLMKLQKSLQKYKQTADVPPEEAVKKGVMFFKNLTDLLQKIMPVVYLVKIIHAGKLKHRPDIESLFTEEARKNFHSAFLKISAALACLYYLPISLEQEYNISEKFLLDLLDHYLEYFFKIKHSDLVVANIFHQFPSQEVEPHNIIFSTANILHSKAFKEVRSQNKWEAQKHLAEMKRMKECGNILFRYALTVDTIPTVGRGIYADLMAAKRYAQNPETLANAAKKYNEVIAVLKSDQHNELIACYVQLIETYLKQYTYFYRKKLLNNLFPETIDFLSESLKALVAVLSKLDEKCDPVFLITSMRDIFTTLENVLLCYEELIRFYRQKNSRTAEEYDNEKNKIDAALAICVAIENIYACLSKTLKCDDDVLVKNIANQAKFKQLLVETGDLQAKQLQAEEEATKAFALAEEKAQKNYNELLIECEAAHHKKIVAKHAQIVAKRQEKLAWFLRSEQKDLRLQAREALAVEKEASEKNTDMTIIPYEKTLCEQGFIAWMNGHFDVMFASFLGALNLAIETGNTEIVCEASLGLSDCYVCIANRDFLKGSDPLVMYLLYETALHWINGAVRYCEAVGNNSLSNDLKASFSINMNSVTNYIGAAKERIEAEKCALQDQRNQIKDALIAANKVSVWKNKKPLEMQSIFTHRRLALEAVLEEKMPIMDKKVASLESRVKALENNQKITDNASALFSEPTIMQGLEWCKKNKKPSNTQMIDPDKLERDWQKNAKKFNH